MSATVTLNRTFGRTFGGFGQGWLQKLARRRWTRTQWATYYELANLSDRQLEDIGIARGLIDEIVERPPLGGRVEPRHYGF